MLQQAATCPPSKGRLPVQRPGPSPCHSIPWADTNLSATKHHLSRFSQLAQLIRGTSVATCHIYALSAGDVA